MDQSVISKIRW